MKISLILLLGLLAISVLALDNTIANREQQATRYWKAKSMKEYLLNAEMVSTNGVAATQELRDQKKRVLELMDWKLIEKSAKASMIATYTADELKAMAEIYENPVTRSAINKSFELDKEFKPVIMLEASRALAKYHLERANQK